LEESGATVNGVTPGTQVTGASQAIISKGIGEKLISFFLQDDDDE
jgi:hypothetical protein